ncbi:cryptochrome/photolyase family protein [Ectothiorhodospiraceae bacterium WFHF3C12]|nr:cryptochrome/photolyase family protein [Ectothiorhodospiraceae bacterium WFHF3C12]
MRNLVIVLGDQLDGGSSALDGFDPARDALWMAEVAEELTYVPVHKLRIHAFLSAMRHFRDACRGLGWTVHYSALPGNAEDDVAGDFQGMLERQVPGLSPQRLVVTEPGDFRVLQRLRDAAGRLDLPLEIREDRHFLITVETFAEWARNRKSLVMEQFYRWMRRRFDVLMDGGEPVGDAWNFDRDNLATFGRGGPGNLPAWPHRAETAIEDEVRALVEARFPDHPGLLDGTDLPLTRQQALTWLERFVDERLPRFGAYQDALWQGEPFLYHSRLSFALNLKLLRPRECIDAAEAAYRNGHAPLNAVEGFIRQLLGWREFIRGVYWLKMPDYADLNALGHRAELPALYWDGGTDMACVADAMDGVLRHGYAHHIQRLMVLGLFALLYGAHPYRFHEWHMAMYLDAVDWVSLPNTLGMSQFGDGGIVGTKPYSASGQYIKRMGNYCAGCRYEPGTASGERACPFTVFYWDFLDRHGERFRGNPRMAFQLKNLDRKRNDPAAMGAIRDTAGRLRQSLVEGERV